MTSRKSREDITSILNTILKSRGVEGMSRAILQQDFISTIELSEPPQIICLSTFPDMRHDYEGMKKSVYFWGGLFPYQASSITGVRADFFENVLKVVYANQDSYRPLVNQTPTVLKAFNKAYNNLHEQEDSNVVNLFN